ncbi:hypothetical protein [Mycobacterium phage WXIN]|nr:hypothetical protein [Mycobacterium phage WXIN]
MNRNPTAVAFAANTAPNTGGISTTISRDFYGPAMRIRTTFPNKSRALLLPPADIRAAGFR